MFDDEKIKLIEAVPEADMILVIWIKLLTLAGKKNMNGYIFLTENIPYTDEMLATLFNRPLNTIRLALETFKKFGMINYNSEGKLKITNWEKHQNVEGLEKIREQGRLRQERFRERKLLPLNNPPLKEEVDEIRIDKNRGVTLHNVTNKSDIFINAWNDFKEMRKKNNKNKPITLRAEEMILNKLDKLSSNEKGQVDILNESTMNDWKGVFPLKETTKEGEVSYLKYESKKISKEEEEKYKDTAREGIKKLIKKEGVNQ